VLDEEETLWPLVLSVMVKFDPDPIGKVMVPLVGPKLVPAMVTDDPP
jgi:hypothetical protein